MPTLDFLRNQLSHHETNESTNIQIPICRRAKPWPRVLVIPPSDYSYIRTLTAPVVKAQVNLQKYKSY